jgi:hypothetical protein
MHANVVHCECELGEPPAPKVRHAPAALPFQEALWTGAPPLSPCMGTLQESQRRLQESQRRPQRGQDGFIGGFLIWLQ